MKYILVLNICLLIGCDLIRSNTSKYKFIDGANTIMFDPAPTNTVKAQVKVIGVLKCPVQLGLLTKKDGHHALPSSFGKSKELDKGMVSEILYEGDWYGGYLGIQCDSFDCTGDLTIVVTYI